MQTVNPSRAQLDYVLNQPGDKGPFVMVNLLKFKPWVEETGESGKEAYDRYGYNTMPVLKRYGAKVLWNGPVLASFIGSDDSWDRVLLVEYPSFQAFRDMISDPEYQEVQKDRERALQSCQLLICEDGNQAAV